MGVKQETVTYVCDGCGTEEVVKGEGSNGFRPHLDVPAGWENIQTKKHEYLIVCYDCFQKQEDVSKLKVLAFIDDCGHQVVIDVTLPRNRVEVYRDILKEAYQDDDDEMEALIAEADSLLKSEATSIQLLVMAGKLIDAVNETDLDEINGGRDGLSPFTPRISWK